MKFEKKIRKNFKTRKGHGPRPGLVPRRFLRPGLGHHRSVLEYHNNILEGGGLRKGDPPNPKMIGISNKKLLA
jgi:hypothetical protein